MRLVFWQNCLSPHQLPYICHLLDDNRVNQVVLVAGEEISEERKTMGWRIGKYYGLNKCKLYIRPKTEIIEKLLTENQEESVHLFSGIHSFPYIFKCLKMSIKYNVRRGMITELPNTFAFGCKNGKPLWLHKVRFCFFDRKYAKKMDCVFAMGGKATHYYQSVYNGWQVFPFMYCTHSDFSSVPDVESNTMKILFVGSLSYWKSPDIISCSLANCMKQDKQFSAHVTYIGDGAERGKIKRIIEKKHLEKFVTLVGFQSQDKVSSWMVANDILILPSIYDGWGAVVNEALQSGMYVICSDACGASDLLKHKHVGQVFHAGNLQQLTQILQWCNAHITEIRVNRGIRRQWAEEHISGRVVAKYMIDCLSGCKNVNALF